LKKTLQPLALILIFSIAAGCRMLPTPSDTIQPPESSGVTENINDDVKSEVLKALPSGAILITSKRNDGANELRFQDFDGDGSQEAFVIYEEMVSNQKVLWASVLKKYADEWVFIWKERGAGYEIDYADLNDITGNGQSEILLGWTLGASAGNGLDIYGWNPDHKDFELVAKTSYHVTLDIKDMPSAKGKDGTVEIAVWQKDLPFVYKVEVLRWKNKDPYPQGNAHFNLVPAEDAYPYYFEKVVNYYNDLLQDKKFEEIPDQAAVLYYLADAQLKTNQVQEALHSIEKGMVITEGYPTKEQFLELRQQVEQTIEYYKSQFEIGLTKFEVIKRFGNEYVGVTGASDDKTIWRYDFAEKEGYTFPEDEMDFVDTEGLKVGFMKMQLFVTWTENHEAHSYSLYYKDKDDSVYHYLLFPDGTDKLEQIKF
jgi:hypothetical protein